MFETPDKGIPKLLPSNPGKGSGGKTVFTRDGQTWTEHFDLVELLASVLRERGYAVIEHGPALEVTNTGFVLLPQIDGLQPQEKGGVQTATTIQFHHPNLVPDGSFEYQHATGENLNAAFRSGFDQWVQMDFVTLLDCLCEPPKKCTLLKFEYPPRDGRPQISRRAILGPPVQSTYERRSLNHDAPARGEASPSDASCDTHDFCPCCLLTRSFETFRKYVEGDGFYGLRFYVVRYPDGTRKADCRVNGENCEEGAAALCKYASTWPEAGFEFRKQYVVLHSPLKNI